MQKRTRERKWRGPSARAGFTLIEVMLAIGIFLMMTLMFAAVIPIALRGTQQSSNYNEAALLAQHKMDQLRAAGFGVLNGANATTQMTNARIIDAVNADGSYDFSTSQADNLGNYFPPGTTGTLWITPDASAGTMKGGVDDVSVTIRWPAVNQCSSGAFTLKNKVINY